MCYLKLWHYHTLGGVIVTGNFYNPTLKKISFCGATLKLMRRKRTGRLGFNSRTVNQSTALPLHSRPELGRSQKCKVRQEQYLPRYFMNHVSHASRYLYNIPTYMELQKQYLTCLWSLKETAESSSAPQQKLGWEISTNYSHTYEQYNLITIIRYHHKTSLWRTYIHEEHNYINT